MLYSDRVGRVRQSRNSPDACMFLHGASLRKCYAGEQLGELGDVRAVFEVRDQGCDRHARASEQPGFAYLLGVAFYGGTA